MRVAELRDGDPGWRPRGRRVDLPVPESATGGRHENHAHALGHSDVARLQRRLPVSDYYAGRDRRTFGRIYCRRQVGSLKATLEFIFVMSADKDNRRAASR